SDSSVSNGASFSVCFGAVHAPVSTFGSSIVASISSVFASTRRYRSTTCNASEWNDTRPSAYIHVSSVKFLTSTTNVSPSQWPTAAAEAAAAHVGPAPPDAGEIRMAVSEARRRSGLRVRGALCGGDIECAGREPGQRGCRNGGGNGSDRRASHRRTPFCVVRG